MRGSFSVATPLANTMPKKVYVTQTSAQSRSLWEREQFGHFLSTIFDFFSQWVTLLTSPTEMETTMNNKMPLSSIFDGKDHETFVSINLALQSLNMDGVPPQLREIAEQALIELIKACFDPTDLN